VKAKANQVVTATLKETERLMGSRILHRPSEEKEENLEETGNRRCRNHQAREA
jgi:hypothetical protein